MKFKAAMAILLILITGFLCYDGYLLYERVQEQQKVAGATITKSNNDYLVQPGSNNSVLNISGNINPQFVMDLSADKFKNLFVAHADSDNSDIQATIQSRSGNDQPLTVDTQVDPKDHKLIVRPKDFRDFKPGKYKLSLKLRTVDGDVNIDQDFNWGVLAINTNKSIYKPGETVDLGMGVLDDWGRTKCFNSKDFKNLTLSITSPSGEVTNFSTENKTIGDSGSCAPISVTNNPDFQAQYHAKEPGTYQMHLVADITQGGRSLDDTFKVEENPAFDIERTSFPTRIYPVAHYPVFFKVTSTQNYTGSIIETVPASFEIDQISDSGKVFENSDFKTIVWNDTLITGTTKEFSYRIKFPMISPEFYLLGPIKIGNFEEARQWQIASDAIGLVQTPATAISSGGASTVVTPSLGAASTTGNFLILVCGSNDNTITWTRPNGWTIAIDGTGTSPSQIIYYKVSAGEQSVSCTQSTAHSETGTLLEYSGIENDGIPVSPVDVTNSSTTCTQSGSVTTTQPDELVFASLLNTKSTTQSAPTNSFIQEVFFNDTGGSANNRLSSGAYDRIVSSTGAYSTSVTNAGAGNCLGQIVGFRGDNDINQADYRFFTNADSATSGNPLSPAQDRDLVLTSTAQAFRLKLLLRVVGSALGTSDGRAFKLQVGNYNGSSCSSYADVTTSTNIKYNDNATPADGANAGSVNGDPIDTINPSVIETYEEANNFSSSRTAISGGSDGLWDFSLKDNSTQGANQNAYCLRAVYADGGSDPLEAYDREIHVFTTAPNGVNLRGGATIHGGTTIH